MLGFIIFGRNYNRIAIINHDGQSFFAIAPSAGSPSGDNPTRNVGNRHIGQSRFANALLAEAFFGHSYAVPSNLTQIDWFLRPLDLASAGRRFLCRVFSFQHPDISSYGVRNVNYEYRISRHCSHCVNLTHEVRLFSLKLNPAVHYESANNDIEQLISATTSKTDR